MVYTSAHSRIFPIPYARKLRGQYRRYPFRYYARPQLPRAIGPAPFYCIAPALPLPRKIPCTLSATALMAGKAMQNNLVIVPATISVLPRPVAFLPLVQNRHYPVHTSLYARHIARGAHRARYGFPESADHSWSLAAGCGSNDRHVAYALIQPRARAPGTACRRTVFKTGHFGGQSAYYCVVSINGRALTVAPRV
ncbi:hypothetical protein KCP70_10930 [Salmonella enterica subsp. enterica]|nr:hypothetical protein KCP70_10930 [Salmonella enterica subsp. enterica]